MSSRLQNRCCIQDETHIIKTIFPRINESWKSLGVNRGTTDIHSYLSVRACGPQEKEGGEDTLALLAKGFALCTPMYEWMSGLFC